jgi:hypothetical protein
MDFKATLTSALEKKNIDNAKPPTVANKAALELVFFQKKPNINMAKIPGLTNPVYS